MPLRAPATLALSLSIALLLTGVVISAALHIWQRAPAQVAVSPFLLGSWSVLSLSGWAFIAMLAVLMVGKVWCCPPHISRPYLSSLPHSTTAT